MLGPHHGGAALGPVRYAAQIAACRGPASCWPPAPGPCGRARGWGQPPGVPPRFGPWVPPGSAPRGAVKGIPDPWVPATGPAWGGAWHPSGPASPPRRARSPQSRGAYSPALPCLGGLLAPPGRGSHRQTRLGCAQVRHSRTGMHASRCRSRISSRRQPAELVSQCIQHSDFRSIMLQVPLHPAQIVIPPHEPDSIRLTHGVRPQVLAEPASTLRTFDVRPNGLTRAVLLRIPGRRERPGLAAPLQDSSAQRPRNTDCPCFARLALYDAHRGPYLVRGKG